MRGGLKLARLAIRLKKVIVKGGFNGDVLVSPKPISFLGDVDKETGRITNPNHPLGGRLIANKVLVFPRSIGSSVGSYVIIALRKNLKAPKAIIVVTADFVLASGCGIANIPLAEVAAEHYQAILELSRSCSCLRSESSEDNIIIFDCCST